MRISRKSILQSSHDLILIIGAMIAIAMMVSSLRHHVRLTQPSLGMTTSQIVVAV